MGKLVSLMSQDRNVVSYRPHLCSVIGSVTATILLQQIVYWHNKNGDFYKFKEPPTKPNTLYKVGDSWCEELAFSRREFDTALKKIGTKVTRNMSKSDVLETNTLPSRDNFDNDKDYNKARVKTLTRLVIYWTD